MPVGTNISLSLQFEQVVELVKQLPSSQRLQLARVIEQLNENSATKKKLNSKEKSFLKEFDESIEFVNNYKPGKTKHKNFKQLLDEL